jgi:hypothetical protein
MMDAFDPALRAAGVIGIWETNGLAGLSVLDAGAAKLLAGDADLAGHPIPLETALRRTHSDDRDWVFERVRRAHRTGGPVSAEFRVLTETGQVRWLLNRGSLAPDETGAMRGLGAYIDTTDSHTSSFLSSEPTAHMETDPLNAVADRCMEARVAIDRIGHQKLRQLSDLLLFEVGRLLARRSQA